MLSPDERAGQGERTQVDASPRSHWRPQPRPPQRGSSESSSCRDETATMREPALRARRGRGRSPRTLKHRPYGAAHAAPTIDRVCTYRASDRHLGARLCRRPRLLGVRWCGRHERRTRRTAGAQGYIAFITAIGLLGAVVAHGLVPGSRGLLGHRRLVLLARAGGAALLAGVAVGVSRWLVDGSLNGDGAAGIITTSYFLLGGLLFSRLGWADHARSLSPATPR